MNLNFLGAAREVTGSCHLIETTDVRFLVDCGMVRGGRKPPARTFVVHGEETGALTFADGLRAERGWDVTVPGPSTRVRWEGRT